MVCLFSSDSQWFKSYGGSNIKIMAQALKMGVPRPNDYRNARCRSNKLAFCVSTKVDRSSK